MSFDFHRVVKGILSNRRLICQSNILTNFSIPISQVNHATAQALVAVVENNRLTWGDGPLELVKDDFSFIALDMDGHLAVRLAVAELGRAFQGKLLWSLSGKVNLASRQAV